MDANRRKFIRNVSFGTFGSFVVFPSYSNEILSELIPPLTLDQRLKIAADMRKQGRINRAINKFSHIVEYFPDEIRAYDGLRKSLLHKKYKELDILQLYEMGYELNPDSKDFKERLAKEYMRLTLGNNKFTNQYNSSENLLQKARNFFKQLKNEYPERKEYLEQFKKAKRKINQEADTVDARQNTDIKGYRKNQQRKFKKRFKDKTDVEVENKLNLLLSKPPTEARKKHIKELYRILIKRNKNNQSFAQAFTFAFALYNFDKTDPLSIKKVKRFAKKTNNYDELVNICQENDNFKNTFWSKLGLFDAQLKKFNKTGIGSLAEMNQILTELQNAANQPQQIIEVLLRKVRLAYKQQNLGVAHQTIKELGAFLSVTQNTHLAVLYSILTARYFTKMQDYNKGIQAIQIALGENEITEISNELLVLVQDVNQDVIIEKMVHINRLNKVLERLNNRQNP